MFTSSYLLCYSFQLSFQWWNLKSFGRVSNDYFPLIFLISFVITMKRKNVYGVNNDIELKKANDLQEKFFTRNTVFLVIPIPGYSFKEYSMSSRQQNISYVILATIIRHHLYTILCSSRKVFPLSNMKG